MGVYNRFDFRFGSLPIFGMIHLAGQNPVRRALKEIECLAQESVDGAIIENYHGSIGDVIATLKELKNRTINLAIGVNILPNNYGLSLRLAKLYGAEFVQLDYIAGEYHEGELDLSCYTQIKNQNQEILVLGGVWPKYYTPIDGSDLKTDLMAGVRRADAIVVTGRGTGMETPLDKIRSFREIIGEHPLLIGAGLTPDNAYEQLCISNGAIVGTAFKISGETQCEMDIQRIRDFMQVVGEVRTYLNNQPKYNLDFR